MNKKNSVADKLRERIPLETKLKVALQAQDLDNWHNGNYSGHSEVYLNTILKTIEKHEREHGVDASASILTLHNVSNSALPTIKHFASENFKNIAEIAKRLTTGNVSHHKNLIEGQAKQCKEFIDKHYC